LCACGCAQARLVAAEAHAEHAERHAEVVTGAQELRARLEKDKEALAAQVASLEGKVAPPPAPRTKLTRRVPHPVLIGHAASLTPY
jgi:hypothetical protein